MQVSPDKNVRVTETNPIGRIPVSPEHAAGLSNGDFLVATVERIQGDTLLLRVDDGTLLNAALQGNMQLAQGDVIEAAVSKDGGTCLLYIVNVLHAGGQAANDMAASVSPQTLSAMLAVIKRNPGLDAEIALYLAQNNIPDTAENIAALSQMSRGTGIGALLGQILELMSPPAQAQQLDGAPSAVIPAGETAPSQGEPLTANPDVAPKGGKSQAAPTAQSQVPVNGETLRTGTQTQTTGPQAAATDPKSNTAATGMPYTDPAVPAQRPDTQGRADIAGGKPGPAPGTGQGETTVPQSAGKSAVPEAQPGTVNTVQPQAASQQGAADAVQPQAGLPQSAPSNTGAVPNTADTNTQYGVQNISAQPANQQEAAQSSRAALSLGPILPEESARQTDRADLGVLQGPDEHIGRLIRGLFLHLDKQSGEDIKRTAGEMSRGLKTLKSELIQTDNKYRELCLKSVDQAMRQIAMADRTAHFEHMQIPFAVKEGEHRTAELYVFRRKNGRKSPAEAGRSILVALDTDHMGRVETLIREESGSISLEFRLQNPDMTGTFKKNSAPLQKAVEAAGYRLSGMRFAGLEKKTTVLNAGEMVSLDAGEATHGIDVQV